MATALDPGDEHNALTEWAQENGVEINGVAPAKFVGRGMGIVAARDLKVCDLLSLVISSIFVLLPVITFFFFSS
jgi:hypothetical protein